MARPRWIWMGWLGLASASCAVAGDAGSDAWSDAGSDEGGAADDTGGACIGADGCPCTDGGGCDPGLVCSDGACMPKTADCGDGVLDVGEECDLAAANADDGVCKSDCTAQRCGDAFEGPGEGCDDGNDADDDA